MNAKDRYWKIVRDAEASAAEEPKSSVPGSDYAFLMGWYKQSCKLLLQEIDYLKSELEASQKRIKERRTYETV